MVYGFLARGNLYTLTLLLKNAAEESEDLQGDSRDEFSLYSYVDDLNDRRPGELRTVGRLDYGYMKRYGLVSAIPITATVLDGELRGKVLVDVTMAVHLAGGGDSG